VSRLVGHSIADLVPYQPAYAGRSPVKWRPRSGRPTLVSVS